MPKRKAPCCVYNEHVDDYLRSAYLYDEKHDKLFVYVEHDNGDADREISLGECKEMIEDDLESLIREYYMAIEEYNKAEDEVNKLIDEIEANAEGRIDFEEHRNDELRTDSGWYSIMDTLYRDALSERDDWANVVSKLYFVISKK